MLRRILLSVVCIVATSSAAAALDKPLGYERFTTLNVNSGIFTELAPSEVYAEFAQPLSIGLPVENPVRNKRLYDIETHRDESGKLTLSGAWIENKGDFEHDSWLVLNLTYGDLLLFAEFFWEDLIPLDVERYDNRNGNLRFAVIFQRNIYKADWLWKIDMTEEQIRFDEGNYRVVDFDRYSKTGSDNGEFIFSSTRYDAIMVANSGPNYVYSIWTTLEESWDWGWSPIYGLEYMLTYYELFGLQATDIEFLNDWGYPHAGEVVLVDSDRDFSIGAKQTAQEASLNQFLYGRAVDLEGGPEGGEKRWSKWHWPGWEDHWQTIFCGNAPW